MKSIERPQGFEKETRDCTIRALSLVANLPYMRVHSAFKEMGRKDGHGIIVNKVLQRVFKMLKLEAKQIKRSGSVNKLIRDNPKGNIFCLKRAHAFALIDGVTHDLDEPNSHIKGAWIITKMIK